MSNSGGPIRERGLWGEMGAPAREDLMRRGAAAIFDEDLRDGILDIFADVRAHGDAALVRALEKFDKVTITADRLRVSDEEFVEARAQVSEKLLAAIRDGIDHVRRFNEQVITHGADWSFDPQPGLTVGERSTPIASAGLFVPSGKGSFPSVLVQLGTPAVVAGVQEIAVVVPPIPGGDGEVDPAVLVVAEELGIRNVFRCNGPAGVAALTFGTETVPKVRKVSGPGSPPVTCAQVEAQRFGTVSVLLLGPSESLMLADASADPYLVAADLLNEAEHGPDSTSVLVTDSDRLLADVQVEIEKQLADLPEQRSEFARAALRNGGAVLTTSVSESVEVANAFAPEHMQVVVRPEDEDTVLNALVDAAEILVGHYTTVSMANFVLGCPAALPTGGYAKVSSGVTATAFRKQSAVAKATLEGLRRVSDTVIAFSQHEGFPAHEASLRRRLERL